MQVKKQQLELDMEQQTGSKSGKEYTKAVCCHPAFLTYIQSTSRKVPGWMKHKLESKLPGEISIISDTQMTLRHSEVWESSSVAQSCLTLCDPMDYSLQGSSVHGIFQARVLEWVAISFSRESS